MNLFSALRLTILAIFVSTNLVAQNSSDSLLLYERMHFYALNDTTKSIALFKKCQFHLKQSSLDSSCLKDFKRVNVDVLPSEAKMNFLWNATLVYLSFNQPKNAYEYFEEYQLFDTTNYDKGHLLIGYIVNHPFDSNKALNYFEQLRLLHPADSCLACLSTNFNLKSKKKLNTFLIASGILPGSGTIMNGKIVPGLTSTAISAAMVYAVVTMFSQSLPVSAVVWGILWELKFYRGNLMLTERAYNDRMNKKENALRNDCQMHLRNALDTHKVNFRF